MDVDGVDWNDWESWDHGVVMMGVSGVIKVTLMLWVRASTGVKEARKAAERVRVTSTAIAIIVASQVIRLDSARSLA